MDAFIKSVVSTCDYVKAKNIGQKKINFLLMNGMFGFILMKADKKIETWSIAPPQLEDMYNFEDALVVGSMLITLLKMQTE